jgi:polysaccharide biosynthesis/export protein
MEELALLRVGKPLLGALAASLSGWRGGAQWRNRAEVAADLATEGPLCSSIDVIESTNARRIVTMGERHGSTIFRQLAVLLLSASLAACSWLPAQGPSSSDMVDGAAQPSTRGERYALVNVDSNVVSVMQKWSEQSFSASFGAQRPVGTQSIGVGDSVQIMIWEAAAGGLFSAPATAIMSAGSRTATIPEQVVGPDGAITVPYAGRIQAAGKTPQQVEAAIVAALTGKAIEPQAVVTVTKNVSNTVTVIGEVTAGARVPLSVRGDRILDVIAQAGGTKAAAHETFLTLARDGRSVRVPLQALLANPAENVFVRPGDVVSVARDPQKFISIGATGKNDIVPFDAIGITLDEAIARAGGLDDARADPAGVFIVRLERPADYDQLGLERPSPGPLQHVPVIYRINMREPQGFFLARRFPMHAKDILFVTNATAVDMQKVVSILLPFLGVGATAVGVAAVARN